MKLKISFILFHILLVLSSAVPVKEDKDYRNKDQKLRKQRSLSVGYHFAPEDLSKLQPTVVSSLEGSIGQINEQVTQNSNRYKATGTPESTTLSASTSHCGGRLQGESGVISYKEYETYNDGESCTWIIQVPKALKIGLKLEKTGLERCCDHVNVSSLETAGLVQQAPIKLKFYHTVLVDGPKAMVSFSSDESVAGLGFRLIYYKITSLNSPIEETINESECGGVIVGETGEISYKSDESYMHNERCVWLIHSPKSTSITFNLQHAGFERCCDFVTITTIDPENGTLRNDTRLLSKNRVTIQEATAVIMFSSDRSISETGFLLKFSARGVNTNPKFVYNLHHIGKPNATIEYPALGSNDDITNQQHIYVTAKSHTGCRESCEMFISGIDLNAGVFVKANDSSCVYDSLTFYEPLIIREHEESNRIWQKKAQIPNENDTLLCPERFSVPKQKGFVDFDVHSFLAIYKPIRNGILESNAAVSFDYYYKQIINESECGGIIVGETGGISYRLDESCMNKERCVWLVHSPNSTSITFNLQYVTFVRCSEYNFVSLTTIDPETGTLRNDTRLLREDTIVTIQEPIAAIVFSSDRSTTGTGFLLKFSGNGVNTNPKFVYKLQHIGELNATIEYPASESNDDDITKHQHIYVTAKSYTGYAESSQRFISGIDMNEGVFLRANDSSCVYDSLTFYEPLVIMKNEENDCIWQKKAQIPNQNDTLLCPERFTVPKQKGFLDFDVNSFLAIYKPISNYTLESNAAVSFDYYTKPYECVEILQPLEDEFGMISYKENEDYKNDENCSWIIEVINATRIDFNLEQSGFQDCCDYIAVTSLDMAGQIQGAKLKLRAGSPTASVTGSRALVNFISDRINVGSGFRLRYGSGIALDENGCGGFLNPMLDDFGVISYKANENYEDNENCVWVIDAPEWRRIGFTLEQGGFGSYYDYVTITPASTSLFEHVETLQLRYYNRNTSITGSAALVRFTSDSFLSGTGFRLRYEKLPALEHQDTLRDEIGEI